jgi:hypothetical protein
MERSRPACRPRSRWLPLCMLPIFLILCLSVFAHATPASAATLYPCQPPYSNSGYYPDLSWGYDVDHAFSTDGGPWYIYVYESGLSQQTQYRTAIYDSNGKYLNDVTGYTTVDGSCLGGFSLYGDYHLQAGYADAVKGEPWHIAVYDMQSPIDLSQTTYGDGIVSVPVYVNYNTGYDPTVATVTGGLVTCLAAGKQTTINVSYGGLTITVPVTVGQPVVTGISAYFPIGPGHEQDIYAGESSQLTVMEIMSDGSQGQNVTDSSSYQVSDPTIATVSNSGLVTVIKQDLTDSYQYVYVIYDGFTDNPSFLALFPVPVSIAASPSPITLPVGGTQQLTVTATMSDMTTMIVTSSSYYTSNDTGIATVSSPPSQPAPSDNSGAMISTTLDRLNYTGGGSNTFMHAIVLGVPAYPVNGYSLVTGMAPGQTTITIAYDGINSTPVPVTVTAPPVQNSSISPTTAYFDQNQTSAAYIDIPVTVTWNGNTLKDIKNGSTVLNSGGEVDYTVSANTNTVTILKSYLSTLPAGSNSTTIPSTLTNSGGGVESFPILNAAPSYFERC